MLLAVAGRLARGEWRIVNSLFPIPYSLINDALVLVLVLATNLHHHF